MAPPVAFPRGEALLDTLRRAREKGEAVGAFNVYNLEGVLVLGLGLANPNPNPKPNP